ncbi:hypothetical protein C7121_11395 [Paenibacillus glucanolyticus]|jgi:hypothetical protein|uniref:hypothetical protein n=1 Tax=Paenibacillus TaxID=44249 RepID=UPI0003E2615F|nr:MULTISPECIES: hypothetical protein [Paenibacillus]ANA79377.1 hypothetical protein A3958_04920 [Paenibacillus glucanolyticus]AVV56676.1 hypothetical protein C7121_11395 [Paenibacillus glucanolyticus]ETT29781.1 hypothetical protein C169_29127 [Paenibacillus sp. FSL R5-808]MPY18734.1 hypothetical protein [Paenibacillus glucanolyticus]OMF77573.1 hypothetical protein BK142_12735 [Paenibacillus glucanolyticus]
MLQKKTSLILTAIISLVLLFSSSVYAYVSLKTGYLSPSIRFAPQGLPSQYESALISAAASWNAASTKVYISRDANADNTVIMGNLSDTQIFGSYTPQFLDRHGQASQFQIWINQTAVVNQTTLGKDFWNVAQSIFAHELGHALHIGDLRSGDVLMNQLRDRNKIVKPQPDDINGVNAYVYPKQ